MKLILISIVLFLFLIGCSKNTNPIEPEMQYKTGQIFMVGSSSKNGLTLTCMEDEEQKEYLMEFENKVIENIAYRNQGKNAKVGYKSSYVSQGITYLNVIEIEIIELDPRPLAGKPAPDRKTLRKYRTYFLNQI